MRQLILVCMPLLLFSCKATKDAQNQALVNQQKVEQAETELTGMKSQVETMYQKNQNLQDNKIQLEKMNQQLMSENEAMQQKLLANQEQLSQVTTEMKASSDDYGVWFRVQIGAFGTNKINADIETTDELSIEDQESLQKISLGRFRDYEDAKALQKHLMEIGIIDAWVVSYKDGQRVAVDSVIETTN
ncbi:MAG: SPOR domain-containing protein [Saprospiraceae bacterium]|nr:SPOR domain-containing protein [Saprospiraceae bacterium]